MQQTRHVRLVQLKLVRNSFLVFICILLQTLKYGCPLGNELIVGHLMPKSAALTNERDILVWCSNDLRKRRVLPKEITMKVVTMGSCHEFNGVVNAAYLHYVQGAAVYFGPGCSDETLVVGRLSARWNVPIVAHKSGDDALSNRTIFSTLGSVALASASEMAQATLTFIRMQHWNKIAIVRPPEHYERLSIHSLQAMAQASNISINIVIDIDPGASVEEILDSGLLTDLRNAARIIIVELGLDVHASTSFMRAVDQAGMKTADFVYILPWLSHEEEFLPWELNRYNRREVKQSFENTITITAHGYDLQFMNSFRSKLLREVGIQPSHVATLNYMSFYDALLLYGLALRSAYDETKNPEIFHNGSLIWKKMTNRKFMGMTGRVLTNNEANRVPSYATYYIRNGTTNIVVELEAKLIKETNCEMEKGHCAEYVAQEVLENWWNSENGQLPPDIPPCGYDGALCDYTAVYITAGVVVFILITGVSSYVIYKKEKERELYDMTWRISRDSVLLLESSGELSRSSLMVSAVSVTASATSKANPKISVQQALCNGIKLSVKTFTQTKNISFSRNELKLIKQMKLIANDNLNTFYGMCLNERSELLVLWVLCRRGSLNDILFNDDLKLGRNFQVSFAKDTVKGLQFLHSSAVGYHGFLCLQNCVVDSNWTVKLTNFCTENIIAEKIAKNELKGKVSNEDDPKKEENRNIKYIQQAPEVIRAVLQTNVLPRGTQPADIFALGMILFQILFRVQPFADRRTPIRTLLEKIASTKDDEQSIRPTFPAATQEYSYNLQLLSCIEACWSEIPELRPNIKKIRSIVNSNLKTKGGGTLIDQMMKMMEEYTTNLEGLVRERAVMLTEAQEQTDRLLHSMLPKSVADDLKVGKTIAPQLYPCTTILFSDIRGFTRISSTSTPLEVVTFLNQLFSGFDTIISHHDAFKVETIGDAYMIASGVPEENGNDHVQNIADVALKMRAFVCSFKLAHRPEEKLMVRIGFHSGPVAAGVVGLNAPRYCLLGDTVNLASHMESSGVPNKIQLSEDSQKLLNNYFPDFIVVERGKQTIKDVGEILTFFLEGKRSDPVSSAN